MSRIARLLPVLTSAAEIPWYLKGGVPAANCLAAYQAIGAASLAASYVNLANPGTYDLTQPSAPLIPTWDTAVGWTFGGTQYLICGINPGAGVANNWSMICKFTNAQNDGSLNMVGFDNGGGGYFGMTPNIGTNTRRYVNGSTQKMVAGAVTSGIMCIAGGTGYLNAASDGAITLGAVASAGIYLGGTNINPWPGNIEAVAIYNIVLSLAQVEAVTAAMGFF